MRTLIFLISLACTSASYAATETTTNLEIAIGYLAYQPAPRPLLSNVIPEPTDAGLRGAELALVDNNSTGRFLKQNYSLSSHSSASAEQLLAAAIKQHDAGIRLFVVNAPQTILRQLATQLPDSLFFNAGSADDELRQSACISNVLHTLPSDAMLTDALAQFMALRQWQRWLLIVGQAPEDIAYAEALRRSAKRFGLTIVAEKHWDFSSDQRRSASAEMPLFTQSKDYDVVVVADKAGDFGEYLPYNTWLPRPVIGTQGLTPVGWHKTIETYGAAQLQKRFEKHAQRWMNSVDFASWIAVRSIATAVTKLKHANPAQIRALALSGQLPIDGFKGRKLSFRPWSGQLRQPIALVHPRSLVSTSPQEGYLHPHNEMDSLGFDQAETTCHLSDKAL
ncbi:MAG: ABC transporter substrate-binding protein [Desulfuromonas sp.]|nr:ABC transporter substrate-binding protein [Desulfuromonas sp.]